MQTAFKSKVELNLNDKIDCKKVLSYIVQLIFDLFFSSFRIINKLLPKRGNSVCVISIHKLGDSIFTFNAINSIKSFYKTDVFIVCHYKTKDIYAFVHPEEFIVPIPKESFHFNDRYLDSKARKLLKSTNPRIIIDLTGVMTSASLIFNSRAEKIYGMNRKIFRSIFDKFTETNTELISKEIYINAIKNILPIVPSKLNKNGSSIKIKKILISPFAGWKSKEWGLGKFIRLAEKLQYDFDVELTFDDTPISDDIIKYIDAKKISYSFPNSTKALIDKIKEADLLIGNDSGPVQIAAFLGKKTFSIYGPTNPDYHLPEGVVHKFIQKKLLCSPKSDQRICFTDGGRSGCPSFECMNLLSVDDIYEHLKESLF
jgi:heptosyltransferase-2